MAQTGQVAEFVGSDLRRQRYEGIDRGVADHERWRDLVGAAADERVDVDGCAAVEAEVAEVELI